MRTANAAPGPNRPVWRSSRRPPRHRLELAVEVVRIRLALSAESAAKGCVVQRARRCAGGGSGTGSGRFWRLSLIETCKMNGVEPYAWLKSTLEKKIAADHPQLRLHELLPWNFDPRVKLKNPGGAVAPLTVQVTPRFPPAGPDGHGSPPSAVLSGRYDFLPSHVLRLIGFANRLRGCLSGFVSALGRSHRRAGPATDRGLDCHAGILLSSVLARGQEQDLPGSLATHPVTLRRSTTPDDPLRLAYSGASGAAPTRLTMKASSLHRFRGLPRRFITCCLRFTTNVAVRHARLASGWRAAPLPGGSRTRWIATRGFNSWHPPLQGLAWRNKRSVVGAHLEPSSR